MSKESTRLRQNLSFRRNSKVPARVMSFTSGKGGVGKTHLVCNTAVALAQQGRSVLLLDADLGLANIDVVLGLEIQHTIHDFLEQRISLDELIVQGPLGIDIIPAASGVESVLHLNQYERIGLLQLIEEIAAKYDYLLIDTPAGIGSDVLTFNGASQEIVCIITPEPTSLTDAYALIKVLSRRFGERKIQIVVNSVEDERTATQTFRRFEEVVHRYLQVELEYLGFVFRDPVVTQAVRQQRPFILEFPSEPASKAVQRIAARIEEGFMDSKVKGGVQFFFEQLLEGNAYGREQIS